MSAESTASILRHLKFVVASWKEDRRTDVELLRSFQRHRDEQAFATLVGRYSKLVWGICLRVLNNPADAEDAFQATFLRLARDAERIQSRDTLASWLFRVARCSAIDLRRMIARQRRLEEHLSQAIDRSPGRENGSSDLLTLLDEELDRLPGRFRSVLILCCLEGRTYKDVALELGCSVAAVHRLVTTAQDVLRQRLI